MSTETDQRPAGAIYVEPTGDMASRVTRLLGALNDIPQADCPVREYFAPGMYAREITIPRGVVLVGAVHKTENLAVLSKGVLELVTDDGTRVISAPCIVRVMPGVQNAAIALEEAVWTNFFPTTETDSDKLVELLTHSKASDLLGGPTNKQLAMSGRLAIKE